LIEVGYLDHDPAWRVGRNLKAEPHELDVWTADEPRQFLAASPGTALYLRAAQRAHPRQGRGGRG